MIGAYFNYEPGWEYVVNLTTYVGKQVAEINKEFKSIDNKKSMEMMVGDACIPEHYRNQRQKVLLTNNWVSPDSLDSAVCEQLPVSWYAVYSGDVAITDQLPDKDFNCFMNRMDVGRQGWLYLLVRRGMFERGYISFNMNTMFKDPNGPGGWSFTAGGPNSLPVFDKNFEDYLTEFRPEHEFIRPKVPYCNFDPNSQLYDIIMRSKFGIVLETYFDRNDVLNFTEKIFRHLKLPRPWLLFSIQHGVKHLRNMGFDVLDDIVDHSYDEIEFNIARQSAILDQAAKLCNLEYTPELIARLKTAAVHNQQLLSNFRDTFHKDMDASLQKAREKLLNL